MPIDADIQAAFGNAAPASASTANVDDDIKTAFAPAAHPAGPDDSEDSVYGTEAGPGYLLTNKEFWKGAGRGAIGTYLSATGFGNKQAEARETQELSQRWGLTGDPTKPEGKAGELLGGFLAPLPGGPVGEGTSAARAASLVDSPQSISAAAASPNIAAASPELQSAVKEIQQSGRAPNPDVLARHIEADSLPVKMQLTEGQATQNPNVLSTELNNRAGPLAQHFKEQNGQLTQNLQAIRDDVGPDVFSTNAVEHGDTLINSYKAKAAAADANISAKYQALTDAAGGQFPVSAPKLLQNVTSQLNDKLLFDHAPKAVMNTLGKLADQDSMTFQNFESLRTNLARTMRSSTDGNERAAAGVIRSAMEELPLEAGAAKLKPLADEARTAARAQFQALDADPAYKAAVNETVPPDRFVQKFIVGGTRDDVATMKQNLAGDPAAQQTMGVAALDHLRKQAGISDLGEGNFSQANFNKHLQAMDPKLSSLVNPTQAQTLETLGNVARYTQFQPRGSFVSNSGTAPALLAHGKNLAEAAVNAKTGGIGGTLARGILKNRAAAKDAERALAPGAGL